MFGPLSQLNLLLAACTRLVKPCQAYPRSQGGRHLVFFARGTCFSLYIWSVQSVPEAHVSVFGIWSAQSLPEALGLRIATVQLHNCTSARVFAKRTLPVAQVGCPRTLQMYMSFQESRTDVPVKQLHDIKSKRLKERFEGACPWV